MKEFKFFQKNPYKDKSRLYVGMSFIYNDYYCIVTKMNGNDFEYLIQEKNKIFCMEYDFYLTTPSAAGRKLNKNFYN